MFLSDMPRLILIFIILLSILLIGLFLIWPKYQKLSNLSREIEAKETELHYIEEYFAKLNRLSEELKKYENQVSKIDFALPSDSSLALLSLINFLQRAGSQNGLIFTKLGSFSLTSPKVPTGTPTPETPSKIKEISLGFEVSGSYFAFKNFLETLEKSAKLIEVETSSFSSEEGGIFSYNLNIKTYSY